MLLIAPPLLASASISTMPQNIMNMATPGPSKDPVLDSRFQNAPHFGNSSGGRGPGGGRALGLIALFAVGIGAYLYYSDENSPAPRTQDQPVLVPPEPKDPAPAPSPKPKSSCTHSVVPSGDLPLGIQDNLAALKDKQVFVWATKEPGYILNRLWSVFYVPGAKTSEVMRLFAGKEAGAESPDYIPLITASLVDGNNDEFYSFVKAVPNGDQVHPKLLGLRAVVEVTNHRLPGRKGWHLTLDGRAEMLPSTYMPDHSTIKKLCGRITIRKVPGGGSVVTHSMVIHPELTSGQWRFASMILEDQDKTAQALLAHNIAERLKNPNFRQDPNKRPNYTLQEVSRALEK